MYECSIYFDGSVTGSRYDIFIVKVDDVNSCSVTDQHPSQSDIFGREHVPDSNRSILGASDHHTILEADM